MPTAASPAFPAPTPTRAPAHPHVHTHAFVQAPAHACPGAERPTEPPGRILLMAPQLHNRQWLSHGLQQAGHQVCCAGEASTIASAAAQGHELLMICPAQQAGGGPDFGDDLWWQLRALRQADARLPVVLLLPEADSTDRTLALELGADVVLDGDCQPRELRARVAALLRRHRQDSGHPGAAAPGAGWQLDAARRRVLPPGGAWVSLTTSEYRLLHALLQQPDRAFSRGELLDSALGASEAQLERSVDLLVSRLRRRLGDDPIRPRLICTVRGQGYRFTPGRSAAAPKATCQSANTDDTQP